MLAEDGEAIIRIYEVSGKLVRKIMMGRLTAGYYVRKNKAAYWNGRNEANELVASGVYMYQLVVNGSRLVRKMVLAR